jgi:integrase/recombinase XerD
MRFHGPVGPLKGQRRNYSHRTAKTYVRIVREFATYFHQPRDKLGPEQIRQYQAHLFQSKKLSPFTVSQYVSALRFFFVKTLRRHFLADYIPFPKSRKRLPTVLSPEEVAQLIDSARSLLRDGKRSVYPISLGQHQIDPTLREPV